MPIRFVCPHCQQKLSISSRKAGSVASCPRCQKDVTVPAVAKEPVAAGSAATSGAGAHAAETAGEAEDAADENPYAQFAVFDDHELVYEQPAAAPARSEAAQGLSQRISLPRYVILTQGVLLGLVALVAFALGLATGGNFFAPSQLAAGPCRVDGTISYAADAGELPDAGAVVMFLPQTKDAGRRIKADGLRPEEPLPDAPLGGAEEIRNLGGAYARADAQGRFAVQLPAPGVYHVLVLSGHLRRPPGQDIPTQDLVKIERYIDRSSDLLADSRYQFSTETIPASRQFSARFE